MIWRTLKIQQRKKLKHFSKTLQTPLGDRAAENAMYLYRYRGVPGGD
jgi:hypothetical protein